MPSDPPTVTAFLHATIPLMVPSGALSLGEELVLQVFKLRHIHHGYGLYYDIFRIELKDCTGMDLPTAIVSLLEKGYLKADPNLPAFYILTQEGFNYIAQTPEAGQG